MATTFTLPSKTTFDVFTDVPSLGDIVTYSIDCSAWEDDNSTISSATWTVEAGNASVSNQSVLDGVLSALVNFTECGKVLISILVTTATQKKKIWLEAYVKDLNRLTDDYGYES